MLRFVISVCLSVCHITFIHSSGRRFLFWGEVTAYASEWWCNSEIKRSEVKVTGNENGVWLWTIDTESIATLCTAYHSSPSCEIVLFDVSGRSCWRELNVRCLRPVVSLHC